MNESAFVPDFVFWFCWFYYVVNGKGRSLMPLFSQEVAGALSTDRVQFLEMLATQLKQTDRKLTRDEGLGLIEMIIELVEDRVKQEMLYAHPFQAIGGIVIAQGKGLQKNGERLLLDGKDPDSVDDKDDK